MSYTRVRARVLLPVTVAPGRPETYETATSPWSSPPPPLAVNARTVRQLGGPCVICGRALLPGERAADLHGSNRTAHTGCIGAQA